MATITTINPVIKICFSYVYSNMFDIIIILLTLQISMSLLPELLHFFILSLYTPDVTVMLAYK